ncbi:MAG: heme exporter protein CcmD [Geminicoccaceae bacterium]|nr:heme exporter protein CcmD [Geminicoccaceae bacterium]MCS7268783.1 heme exporter protein CcmD [Geminicoccaceae bacterium]MCX7631573.1 heme exporter protein CcmD [Geminicoccaceae bacterium]MDW8125669.1 heme exporter protein CcmD [Geminicoccaceae bacterium]MDW8340517.1 heme exporter protein CcmD [Geminicoccaceae bacterium]
MREFLAMGGYGPYVWAAYGISLAALVGLFWQSRRLARKRTAEAERIVAERRGRARAALVAERRPSAGPGEG